MDILDKYRLELVWDRVTKSDEIFTFKNARFEGPGLKNTAKIPDNNYIDLDLTSQYIIIMPRFYIARLSWHKIDYAFERVYLGNCSLKCEDIRFAPKLNDDDIIVIDLYDHEEHRHHLNLVYKSYVHTKNGYLYDFENKRAE